MRTTIDLPEEIFRAAKMRAVQQGSTLKELITECLRVGLTNSPGPRTTSGIRREPPPVAIRKDRELAPTPALRNQQLNAILEDQEVETVHKLTAEPEVSITLMIRRQSILTSEIYPAAKQTSLITSGLMPI